MLPCGALPSSVSGALRFMPSVLKVGMWCLGHARQTLHLWSFPGPLKWALDLESRITMTRGGGALSEQGSSLSGYIGPYWSEAGFVLVISSGIPVAMGPSEIPSLAL